MLLKRYFKQSLSLLLVVLIRLYLTLENCLNVYYLDNFSSPETFFNSEPLNSLSPYILNSSNEENNNFFILEIPIYEEKKYDRFDEYLISQKEKEENIFKSH